MSAAVEQLRSEFDTVRVQLPGSVIAPERRSQAIAALCAQGLPSAREENWRYTNLRILERARFAPVDAHAEATLAQLPETPAGFARWVFVDGLLRSGTAAEDPGFSVRSRRSLPAALAPAWPLGSDLPEARLALLNEAFALDALAIDVHGPAAPAGIELVFVTASTAQAGTSYPRVHLRLAAGVELTVIERHLGAPQTGSLVNGAMHVELGEHARLQHYRLQQSAAQTTWFDTLAAELSAHAHYRLLSIGTGAQSARSTVHVRLAGAGAHLELSAAALADRQQSQDMYVLSEHLAPDTRTTETFRGIASGRGRVAFNGKIVVHPQARGSDSRQSLRGLLDGPEAEIDVRPQLEIYTDEVRCSHGATAGKLDENMLFYLLARGIGAPLAQQLLKWAFLEDVVAQIARTELRGEVERALSAQMNAAAMQELC